ncbi:MAG: hypothetical protein KDA66_15235 [Planctomycetaceae bacterium]|nr:hypothetical protein [Planctomycetaceae bacterium]
MLLLINTISPHIRRFWVNLMSLTQLAPTIRLLYHGRYDSFRYENGGRLVFEACRDPVGVFELTTFVLALRCDPTEWIREFQPNTLVGDAVEIGHQSPLLVANSSWIDELRRVFPNEDDPSFWTRVSHIIISGPDRTWQIIGLDVEWATERGT